MVRLIIYLTFFSMFTVLGKTESGEQILGPVPEPHPLMGDMPVQFGMTRSGKFFKLQSSGKWKERGKVHRMGYTCVYKKVQFSLPKLVYRMFVGPTNGKRRRAPAQVQDLSFPSSIQAPGNTSLPGLSF